MGDERLYCDCCGKQVMAVKRGDRIIIKAVHHGREHVLVMLLPATLRQTQGTACQPVVQ